MILSDTNQPQTANLGDEAPKIQKFSDVSKESRMSYDEFSKLNRFTSPQVKADPFTKVLVGIEDNIKQSMAVKDELREFWGETEMSLGNIFGSDLIVKRGRENIQTADRNLQKFFADYEQNRFPLSEEDLQSFSYGVGQGFGNYGIMLASTAVSGGLGKLLTLGKGATKAATFGGIGTMAALETGSETLEGVEKYKEKTQDYELKNITPEWAGKEAISTAIYSASSAIIEKKFGLGEQVGLFKTKLSALKGMGKFARSEFTTETLQGLLNTSIDVLDKTIESKSELGDALLQNLKEGAIAAVVGGGVGISVAYAQRANAIGNVKEIIKGTVPQKDLDTIATSIVDDSLKTYSDVVARELSLSSQLQAQHGQVWDAMRGAIKNAIDDSIKQGNEFFAKKSEEQIGEYINSTSKLFADQVLAEANKRGALIQDVLDGSKIVYQNGKLYLRGTKKNTKGTKKVQKAKVSKPVVTPSLNEAQTEVKEVKKTTATKPKKADVDKKFVGEVSEMKEIDATYNQAGKSDNLYNVIVMLANNDPKITYNKKDMIISDKDGRSITIYGTRKKWQDFAKEKIKSIKNEFYDDDYYGEISEDEDYEPKPDDELLEDIATAFEDELDDKYGNIGSVGDQLHGEKLSFTDFKHRRGSNTRAFRTLGEFLTEEKNLPLENPEEYGYNYFVNEVYKRFYEAKAKQQNYVLLQESLDLAEENARLDDMYPEYKGETININGKEKTVYNSNGDRIAKSEEALRNFYKWFGDSKVVDEQGRPLVVYHGTNADFDTFDIKKFGKTDSGMLGKAFYLTPQKEYAKKYGNIIKELYINVSNPLNIDEISKSEFEKIIKEAQNTSPKENIEVARFFADSEDFKEAFLQLTLENKSITEALSKNGYDGIIYDNFSSDGKYHKEYAVFDSNQIKSTDNRGTYSLEDDNIYYQDDIAEVNLGDEGEGNFYYEFAGEKALTASLDKLNTAIELEAEGKSNEEIRQQTGWFKGIDGKWRFEISDADAKVRTDVIEEMMSEGNAREKRKSLLWEIEDLKKEREKNADLYPEGYIDEMISNRYDQIEKIDYDLDHGYISQSEATLGEILEHDKLYSAYPSLKNLSVSIKDIDGSAVAYYDERNNNIVLNYRDADSNDLKSTLLHEIQHYIQKKEGFARGGNKESVIRTILNESGKLHNTADYNAYERAMADYTIAVDAYNVAEVSTNPERVTKKGWYLANGSAFSPRKGTKYRKEYINEKASDFVKEIHSHYVNDALYDEKEKYMELVSKDIKDINKAYKSAKAKLNRATDKLNLRKIAKYESLVDQIENNKITGYELYERLFGEIEARNTETRMDMTEEERLATSPESTQDISSSDAIIVFDDGTMASYVKKLPQTKRGAYNVSEEAIEITETADFSTLPHELAHFWLDNQFKYAKSGLASQEYLDNFKIIQDFLGIDDNQMTIKRYQQEKFARSYEKYLRTKELPNPMIQSAFDKYNKWLRMVYHDANGIRYRNKEGKMVTPHLTEDAVRFFRSMTTGVLEAPVNVVKTNSVAIQKEDRKQKEEGTKYIETIVEQPTPTVQSTSIKTDNFGKGSSRVYERETGETLEYNKINLEDQEKRAIELVKKDLPKARRIALGMESADDLTQTAVNIAYRNEMRAIGNMQEYIKALEYGSASQTMRGQEISAERIAMKTPNTTEFWYDKATLAKTEKVADKIYKKLDKDVYKDKVKALNEIMRKKADQLAKDLMTTNDKQKVIEAFRKSLKEEYEVETLYQDDLDDINEENVKSWAYNFVEKNFNVLPTDAEVEVINSKIENLGELAESLIDENGNPSLEALRAYDQMNKYIESLNPSNNLAIFTSVVARAVMLASVKSPILNIISNAETLLTEGITNRVTTKLTGGTLENIVSPELKKKYLEYGVNAYRVSGFNMSTAENLNFEHKITGEKIITTQGKGKFKEFAQKLETGVFRYSMGFPDSVSKDLAFIDRVSLEASNIAFKEGLTGKKAQERADELFKDAIRIEPMTDEGESLRKHGMTYAHKATFTDDNALSKGALAIRDALNTFSGNLRAGDNLMPFVKTPASVINIGLDYTIGAVYAIPHLDTIIRDAKRGEMSDISRKSINSAVRNGLGLLLATLIAFALDEDDYVPAYEDLSIKDSQLLREKNVVYNSIKIGDKYISLDYLGSIGVPVAGILGAKRSGAGAFAGNVLSQFLRLPGVKDFSDAVSGLARMTKQSSEKNIETLQRESIDFIASRTIPALVSDIAKAMDSYERDMSNGIWDRVIGKVPGLREDLPKKYSVTTGQPIESNGVMTLFTGARVKTAQNNKLIDTIEELREEGESISLADPTRYGDLKKLDVEDKIDIKEMFAREFARKANDIINRRTFDDASSSRKAKLLNKARTSTTKKIKREYRNKILEKKER